MAEGMWSGSNPSGQDPTADALRIGDAEREQATEDLRVHTVAGRLTMEEYAERLDAVYSARTWGDLRPIMADLPSLRGPQTPSGAGQPGPFLGPLGASGPAPHQQSQPRHQSQPHRQAYGALGRRGGPSPSVWMVWVAVAIVITVASSGLFWPVWVIGPLLLMRAGRHGGSHRHPRPGHR